MWKVTILGAIYVFESHEEALQKVSLELATWKETYKKGAKTTFAIAYIPEKQLFETSEK